MVFYAVSAFNNAGFSTYSDSLMGFQNDWLFLAPIMLAIVFSSLGFLVIHELQSWATIGKGRPWALYTKITLFGTAVTVVLLSLTLMSLGTNGHILLVTDFPLVVVLFETISAFAAVSFATGITSQLLPVAELVLIVLMLIGRVSAITIVTALALGRGRSALHYLEERPIVG